ncbi:MAG: hypothetical protein EAZ36_01575 [Verrucomicrobia bacterium]|nr:MAG: hypothetical protein EAZ36_01575 [Verrucomicrobiota bacterium]
MKLLFLHGPPAVGKLTVAREVSARTGWRLFHNHLAVDVALSLYDFGTPGFIALREQIWFAALRRALVDGPPGVIFTLNPENSVPQRSIDELFAEIAAAGGEVIVVELTADEAEIERRLAPRAPQVDRPRALPPVARRGRVRHARHPARAAGHRHRSPLAGANRRADRGRAGLNRGVPAAGLPPVFKNPLLRGLLEGRDHRSKILR